MNYPSCLSKENFCIENNRNSDKQAASGEKKSLYRFPIKQAFVRLIRKSPFRGTNSKTNVIDLFVEAGGMSPGFKIAGDIAASVEIYPIHSTAHQQNRQMDIVFGAFLARVLT